VAGNKAIATSKHSVAPHAASGGMKNTPSGRIREGGSGNAHRQ